MSIEKNIYIHVYDIFYAFDISQCTRYYLKSEMVSKLGRNFDEPMTSFANDSDHSGGLFERAST